MIPYCLYIAIVVAHDKKPFFQRFSMVLGCHSSIQIVCYHTMGIDYLKRLLLCLFQ